MPARPGPSERSLLEAAARWLDARGYRTYIDPDGTSYFDLVARRGEEVGLVEGKVGNPSRVLAQALTRRGWGDWVAVVLDRPRSARRLAERTETSRSSFVGVWYVEGTSVSEVRAPRPRPSEGADDPYAPLRARLRSALDDLDRGDVPPGVRWSGVPQEVRRSSGGRRFAEWRLDEPPR